jgi:aspartyl-tRNA(Asn)/glutamyl-tRNA(Gln) amidotransferase subunit C
MTQISRDDVQYLARLSNLQLDDKQVDSLLGDIQDIISYINQLSELNTSGIEPTYQVTDLKNVWRDDVIDDYDIDRDKLLGLVPERVEHQVKVPKVLET